MTQYPTDADLSALRTLANDVLTAGFAPLLAHLQAIWWQPKHGIVWSPESGALELHTGGWSGNEEIMGVLRETLFWSVSWREIKRGGHYYLAVPASMRGGD